MLQARHKIDALWISRTSDVKEVDKRRKSKASRPINTLIEIALTHLELCDAS